LADKVKARILWAYDREWEKAEKEYRNAEELAAGSDIHGFDGFTDWMGRKEERLSQVERQLEQADPLSASQQAVAGYAFLYWGESDRAIQQSERVLELEPDSPIAFGILSFAYQQKRMFPEMLEAELRGMGDPASKQALREAYEKSGYEGYLRFRLDRHLNRENPKLVHVASLYSRLGDKDKAFEWLEKAWSKPLFGFEHAPSCFWWDRLRDDPRFETLLRKQNLPKEAIARHLAQR
jgi:tetratricopeptide (TPR) repeat protein